MALQRHHVRNQELHWTRINAAQLDVDKHLVSATALPQQWYSVPAVYAKHCWVGCWSLASTSSWHQRIRDIADDDSVVQLYGVLQAHESSQLARGAHLHASEICEVKHSCLQCSGTELARPVWY